MWCHAFKKNIFNQYKVEKSKKESKTFSAYMNNLKGRDFIFICFLKNIESSIIVTKFDLRLNDSVERK